MKSRAIIYLFPIFSVLSAEEVVFETEFLAAEGYVDGAADGQNDWLAADGVEIDSTAGRLILHDAASFLSLFSPFQLAAWDRLKVTTVVEVDFSKDINQTPLRLGFTTTTNEDETPIPLPFENSIFGSTAIAGELFRDGYPYLQTPGAGHHQGTVTFAPFSGAQGAGTVSLTGAEAGIYPHARLASFTSQDGGEFHDEVQFISPVPLVDSPELGETDAYRLILAGEQTVDLFRGDSAAQVTAAIEGLSMVGLGNVAATGDFASGYEVTFGGALAGENLPQFEVVELAVQDHVTQRLELSYEVLKRATDKQYEVTVSLKNMESGLEMFPPTQTLTDVHSHSSSDYFLSLRAGNLLEGGRIMIESLKVEKEARDGDEDGDGFTNLQELVAGSGHRNPASTPLFEALIEADFGDESVGLLNDSPNWRAGPEFFVIAPGLVHISPFQQEQAITEISTPLEIGETLLVSTEFRLSDAANLAVADASIFAIGVTGGDAPSSSFLNGGALLSSSTLANGTLFFSGESIGGVGDLYDASGYDSVISEADLGGSPRTSGPSDWMRVQLMIVKNEPAGSFTLRKRIADLEGDSQETWDSESVLIDLELWNAASLKSGFEVLTAVSSQVLGAIEVRSHSVTRILDGDYDSDRLSDDLEIFIGTSSLSQDSDGDLQSDWYELENGTDPLNPFSFRNNIPLVTISYRLETWGEVSFELTGAPGKRVTVESSSDMETWQQSSRFPQTVNAFGQVSVEDYFDINVVNRLFFRAAETGD